MKKIIVLLAFAVLMSCGEKQVKSGNDGELSITILHVNDTHGHVQGDENEDGIMVGGFAKIAGYAQQERADKDNVLLLHAGDILTGTVFSSIYHGEVSLELMNRMGFDACTIGNHEFDYGISNFMKIRDEANFPFVSANVFYNGELLVEPYLITNMDGYNAVIMGLTTSDIAVINTDVWNTVTIENEAVTLSNYIYGMKLADTNELFILLTHCGYDVDREIAELFPEIDIIIGGHTHTDIFSQRGRVMIAQAGSDSEKIGVLDVEWIPGEEYVSEMPYGIETNWYRYVYADRVLLDDSVPADESVDAYISEMETAIDVGMDVYVTTSDYYFDNSELRTKPVALGNLVPDILHNYGEADVVIINAGSIRNELPSGELTLRELYELYPFDNVLVLATLKGKYLKEVAAQGVESLGKGAFLYFSDGFKVDASVEGEVTVTLNGEPVEDEQDYKIAVSDYVFEGGDNYTQFANATDEYYTGWNLRDLIIQYLEEQPAIDETIYDDEPRVILPATE